jgi:hypothetical protein
MTIGGNTALDPSRPSDQLQTGGVPRETGPHIVHPNRHHQPKHPRKHRCRNPALDPQTITPLTWLERSAVTPAHIPGQATRL